MEVPVWQLGLVIGFGPRVDLGAGGASLRNLLVITWV
jgi:hypothetical protein